MRAGGGAAYVAVDAEAMGDLARRLERAADELQLARRSIAATIAQSCLPTPCALDVTRSVETEVRDAAESVRRRYADVVGRCLVDPPGAVSWTVQLPTSESRRPGGWKGWAHGLLDGAGMAPVVGELFDVVNGVWYAVEGEWADAALSMAAVLPVGGQLASASRYLDDAADAVRAVGGGKHASVLRRGHVTMDELVAMERSGGHALSRHVGQTVEQLAERQLREGLPAVSTFHSADDALVAVNKALSEYPDEVSGFLAGTKPWLKLVTEAPGLGLVLEEGSLRAGTHARVVLRRTKDDVLVLTAMMERIP